jgi:hypothetical protein
MLRTSSARRRPGCGDSLRETPDGNLVIHQNSTNTIGIVPIDDE